MKWIFMLSVMVSCLSLFGQSTSPCACCTPEHRAFDFWLGEWVTYANDRVAGTNTISVIQDSCVIREEWISARGNYTGTSYNYYDKNTGKWNQVWIDNQGSPLVMEGERVGNQMIMQSAPVRNTGGKQIVNRITWTLNADGTVRQVWETSTDNGPWAAVFDGLYKRKEK